MHVKQRNGINSSIPVNSKVRAAREKPEWKLLALAAVLLLTRDKGRAGFPPQWPCREDGQTHVTKNKSHLT